MCGSTFRRNHFSNIYILSFHLFCFAELNAIFLLQMFKNSYVAILYLSVLTNFRNCVTLIKVVITRNVETRCNHDCTFIHEWVHHRSPDSVYVRMRTRQWRRSSRLHGNLELACIVSKWYTIRLGKKPLSHIGEWWMVRDGWWTRANKSAAGVSIFRNAVFEKDNDNEIHLKLNGVAPKLNSTSGSGLFA